MTAGRAEVLVYATSAAVVYALAVLPHVLDYGWAWGWPGAGGGFALSLFASITALAVAFAATILVFVRPKRPLAGLILRAAAVPFLWIGPTLVFASFEGLATSVGRGLAARVRIVTPVETLQRWAVDRLNTQATNPLPETVARTLPRNPEIETRTDHMALRWYDRGVLVGDPSFYPRDAVFFLEEVRPGVYAFVVER